MRGSSAWTGSEESVLAMVRSAPAVGQACEQLTILLVNRIDFKKRRFFHFYSDILDAIKIESRRPRIHLQRGRRL